MSNRIKHLAIFHDFFGSIGGGEKLVLELAHGLKKYGIKSDIITTELSRKNLERINEYRINVLNLGKVVQLPILKQIHSSWLFHKADFTGMNYDMFLITGNWAVFAARKHRPNIYYVFTPVRMFYDGKEYFYKIAPWYAKLPFLAWVHIHKHYVEKQLGFVDKMVTISKNVQQRLRKYQHMDSRIIYPSVKHYPFRKYGKFWLSVNRIYPHKRIELQIESFRMLPDETLYIVGGYMKGDHAARYAKKILSDMPPNVKYLGEVDENALARLYGECKAFITTAKDEDFGMTVLEANSAGKAVVAVNEGGYKETVIDGKTGYLVKPQTASIVDAVGMVSKNPKKYHKACIANASRYSLHSMTGHFVEQVQRLDS